MTDPSNTDNWQGEAGWFRAIECPMRTRSQKEPFKKKKKKHDVMQLFYAHSGPVIATVAWICIPATLKGLLNWMEL